MRVLVKYLDRDGKTRACFANVDENATTGMRSEEVKERVARFAPDFIAVRSFRRIQGTVRGKP